MKQVKIDFSTPPAVLLKEGTENKKGAILQIKQAVKGRTGKDYSTYRNTAVLTELKKVFNNKCAYCESKVFEENELLDDSISETKIASTIDHYRPKDAVCGFENTEHHGYYWLGNEWSNLLLCCSTCNIDHKKTQFPIEDEKNRIFHYTPFQNNKSGSFERIHLLANSPFLQNEKPLIIHPFEDTEIHIGFDNMGNILGKTERGKKTIEVCNLNRFYGKRNGIIREIRDIFETWIFALIKGYLSKEGFYEMLKSELEKLYNKANKKHEFSAWYRHIWDNFEDCILPHITPNTCHSDIKSIFEGIKKKKRDIEKIRKIRILLKK